MSGAVPVTQPLISSNRAPGWGFYGHASTREAADLRETNCRFYAYLRTKGFEPAGGEAQDGLGWASWRNRTNRLFAALFPPEVR